MKNPLKGAAAIFKPAARNQTEADALASRRAELQRKLEAKMMELDEAAKLRNEHSERLNHERHLHDICLERLEKVHASLKLLLAQGAPTFVGNALKDNLVRAWNTDEAEAKALVEELGRLTRRIEAEVASDYPTLSHIQKLSREKIDLVNELSSLE